MICDLWSIKIADHGDFDRSRSLLRSLGPKSCVHSPITKKWTPFMNADHAFTFTKPLQLKLMLCTIIGVRSISQFRANRNSGSDIAFCEIESCEIAKLSLGNFSQFQTFSSLKIVLTLIFTFTSCYNKQDFWKKKLISIFYFYL